MRNVSHGARCARILQRMDDAVSPGIEYENGYRQQQAVLLGPVGNLYFSARFADGTYLAETKIVRKDRLKPGHHVVYSSHVQRFYSFEDALSRAVSMFTSALTKEQTVIDYAMSFGDYCAAVLEDQKAKYARGVAGLRDDINRITQKYGHLLRARDEIVRRLRKAGVNEDELTGTYNERESERSDNGRQEGTYNERESERSDNGRQEW